MANDLRNPFLSGAENWIPPIIGELTHYQKTKGAPLARNAPNLPTGLKPMRLKPIRLNLE
jgi:hypothetical protein